MAQSAVVNTPRSAEVTWPICLLTLLLAIPLGGLCAMVSLVSSMFYLSLPQKLYLELHQNCHEIEMDTHIYFFAYFHQGVRIEGVETLL